MNKGGALINFLVAVVLCAVLGGGLWLLAEGRAGVRCKAVVVRVVDSTQVHFLDSDRVGGWLDSAGIQVEGTPLRDLDLMQIQRTIERQPYVAKVWARATMRGDVEVSVRQYVPLVRVVSETGYDFYADTLGHIIPTQAKVPQNVPLVTGGFVFDFAPDFFGTLDTKKGGRDVDFLKNLINFVQFIELDPFLRGLVAQVYVGTDRSVELWGRVAGQVIEVGRLGAVGGSDDWREKLHKVADFFRAAPRDIAAGRACRMVVKYRDQIIVKYDGQYDGQ